ncbi:MAG: hypothetical protein WC554_12060 [Clostridia bacterium]
MKKIPKKSICNNCENALKIKVRTLKTYNTLDREPKKIIEDEIYMIF